MASFRVTSEVFNSAVVLCLLMTSMEGILVSSYQFEVGGETGWVKPTGNETETYNEWATRNRFHIGDTIYFKYHGDSVLVVNSADYQTCNTLNPISRFEDRNTVIQLDRSGLFYFISGQPGHCKSRQRLVIRVMHPSEVESPSPEPAASPEAEDGSDGWNIWDSDNWGPPGLNSTTKLDVASYFMTALGAVLVIFYWFI